MRAKKTLRNRSIHHKNMKNSRGISPVISTIIISGTLLIILVIASFVSANVLELQIASTEFEQAKTNMLLLDEVIQDVALRRGSGGYVQFNQRSGGIGIYNDTEKIRISGTGSQTVVIKSPTATSPPSGGWANSTGAYADGGTNANIESAMPSASQTFRGYGFDFPSGTKIERVRVWYDAWRDKPVGDVQIRVDVSWDNGGTWSPKESTPLNTTETTYWYDVPGAASWTASNLSDTNFLVRVDALTVNMPKDTVRLDWIPVEVTFVPPMSNVKEYSGSINIVYRGGSRVSASNMTLRPSSPEESPGLIVNMTNALSYLRVETGQGVRIKLDYNRIRIVEMGTLIVNGIPHNFIEVTYVRLVRESMGGSGTVNVKVQNIDVQTTTRVYDYEDVTIEVQIGSNPPESRTFMGTESKTVVMFTEILVQVSTA